LLYKIAVLASDAIQDEERHFINVLFLAGFYPLYPATTICRIQLSRVKWNERSKSRACVKRAPETRGLTTRLRSDSLRRLGTFGKGGGWDIKDNKRLGGCRRLEKIKRAREMHELMKSCFHSRDYYFVKLRD
jgi:hypothetical protein